MSYQFKIAAQVKCESNLKEKHIIYARYFCIMWKEVEATKHCVYFKDRHKKDEIKGWDDGTKKWQM